jgi:HSP20 family protein
MTRYDPFEEMNRMFEQPRTRVWTLEGSIGGFETPARGDDGVRMDLNKHGDEYVFAADLPGFDREEIDLGFEDGVLTLSTESERRDGRADEREDGVAVRAEPSRGECPSA